MVIGGKEVKAINIMTTEGNIIIASITDEDALSSKQVIIEFDTGEDAKIKRIHPEFGG
jgi:hypothetical protein